MAFPAFFDTSAIFGGALNDVFLTLAELGLYRPLWSTGVLEELRRTVIAHGIDASAVDYRITAMQSAFPDAETRGYDDLASATRNDADDRHVLAAAVRTNAEVLVTFNIRHFPPRRCRRTTSKRGIRMTSSLTGNEVDTGPILALSS